MQVFYSFFYPLQSFRAQRVLFGHFLRSKLAAPRHQNPTPLLLQLCETEMHGAKQHHLVLSCQHKLGVMNSFVIIDGIEAERLEIIPPFSPDSDFIMEEFLGFGMRGDSKSPCHQSRTDQPVSK